MSTSRKFGPSVFVIAATLGPATILASAKVGAFFGYSAIWVLLLAAILLGGMASLAVHIGLVYEKTPLAEIADRLGRRTAAILGILLFFTILGLQVGINLAITTATWPLLDQGQSISAVLIINLLAITAIYRLPGLYQRTGFALGGLIITMALAFLAVAIAASPSILGMLKGMIPVLPKAGYEIHDPYLILQTLIAATLSIPAAFFLAYLMRERGWNFDDSDRAQGDASLGVLVITGIALAVTATAAAVFYGKTTPPSLAGASDLAVQLGPPLGNWAKIVFSAGILFAAIAALVANAIIAGTILSDGFGGSAEIGDRWPRHASALALVIGLSAVMLTPVRVLLLPFVQALAVIGVPTLACALIYLGTRPELTGSRKLPRNTLSLAYLGGAVLLVVAFRIGSLLVTQLFL